MYKQTTHSLTLTVMDKDVNPINYEYFFRMLFVLYEGTVVQYFGFTIEHITLTLC